jgi:hypothetical protein
VPVAPDGSFTLRGLTAERARLELVIPAPPRTGADLRVSLEPIRIGDRDVDREFDLAGRLPGRIEVQAVFASAPPRHRIAVVATELHGDPSERHVHYLEQKRRRRHALLDPAGKAILDVAPWPQRVQLVDIATGVVLAAAEHPVRITPGAATSVELKCPFAILRIGLRPTGGLHVVADSIEVRATTHPGDSFPREMTVFGHAGSFGDLPGVDLHVAPRPILALVPPGPVVLRVPRPVLSLQRGGSTTSGDNGQLGEAEVEAEAGRTHDVRIEVSQPPPMKDEERK